MRPEPDAAYAGSAKLWPWWLAWVVFVVYGSLAPLGNRLLPLGTAWPWLLHAPLLDVGVQARADWIANGVLYYPVGFLTAGMLRGRSRAGAVARACVALGATVFGGVLAVTVELAQTAFPARPVSLNDLLAETMGSAFGAAVTAALLAAVTQTAKLFATAIRPDPTDLYIAAAAAWAAQFLLERLHPPTSQVLRAARPRGRAEADAP